MNQHQRHRHRRHDGLYHAPKHGKASPLDKLKPIQDVREGELRYSQKGVPYFITRIRGVWYSVTYFADKDYFRVFWPFLSDNQRNELCATAADVLDFLASQATSDR